MTEIEVFQVSTSQERAPINAFSLCHCNSDHGFMPATGLLHGYGVAFAKLQHFFEFQKSGIFATRSALLPTKIADGGGHPLVLFSPFDRAMTAKEVQKFRTNINDVV